VQASPLLLALVDRVALVKLQTTPEMTEPMAVNQVLARLPLLVGAVVVVVDLKVLQQQAPSEVALVEL